jgi:hypothetical protein
MNVDNVVQIWLDAEEELRNGNEATAIQLKEKCSIEFDKLSDKDKVIVQDELDNLAG